MTQLLPRGHGSAKAELEEKLWQLFTCCVLDCRDARSPVEEDQIILDRYLPQAIALIDEERTLAVHAKLADLYSLPAELRSPLWRRLRVEVARLRAQR